MKPNYEEGGWKYAPRPDITTWELAQAMRAFLYASTVETFPPEVKRHFVWQERKKEKWKWKDVLP